MPECRACVAAYPIGVDVDSVIAEATEAMREEAVSRLTASLLGRKLIVGVDRLDYSKGLPSASLRSSSSWRAFRTTWAMSHSCRSRHSARSDVLAYSDIRQRSSRAPAALNGRFAQTDWTPIRYLNRNFPHATTMGFCARPKWHSSRRCVMA